MFFDGQVEAEALLARAGAQWARSDEPGSSASPGRPGGGGAHFGGSAGGVGMGRGGGAEGGTNEGGPQAPPIHAINQPGVQLRLRLTNHRDVPIVVEVVDFNSDLGDFVVQPAQITVQPGESVEADPMVSRLGVGAEEIPLIVKLRIDGRSDQQVLALKTVKEEALAAPPPAEGAPVPATTSLPP